MKKYSLLPLLVLLTYVFVLSSCEKEEVETNQDLLNITSDSFRFTHTGAEVDKIIMNEYGKVEQTTPEAKMKILKEIIVKKHYMNLPNDGVTSRSSNYVLIAQVFQRPTGNPADDIYTTEVKTSNGVGNVEARVIENPPNNLVQIGCSADIYLNSVSVGGRIAAEFNFDCGLNNIDVDARARLFGTYPDPITIIQCND